MFLLLLMLELLKALFLALLSLIYTDDLTDHVCSSNGLDADDTTVWSECTYASDL